MGFRTSLSRFTQLREPNVFRTPFVVVGFAFVAVVTSVSLLRQASSAQDEHKVIQKWEYKSLVSHAEGVDTSTLNHNGLNGWELVTVLSSKDEDAVTHYILKRPRP